MTKKIEGFDGEILHPSLDIHGDILTLGFRYRAATKKEENIILVIRKGMIEITQGESFAIDGREYSFEMKGRKLIRIQDRWSLVGLNRFREEYEKVEKSSMPNPRQLFEEVKTTIKRYVELEKEADCAIVASWILGTYFYPIFAAYPFLNLKAPKRSGKSQMLNLMRQLCFNAIKARPTVASLGDTVDGLRGTYLMDQADSLGRKGTEELLDTITDSYKRGGGKRRVMSIDKGTRSILEFETYSPKAFASTRELPEDLRDRCFIVPLMRSTQNFLDPDEESDTWITLREQCYKFLIDGYINVASEYVMRRAEYRQTGEMVGRTLELWLPIETMLRCCGATGEIFEAKKRFLAQYNFSEWEPDELERAVIELVLHAFPKDEAKIELRPIAIADQVDSDFFPLNLNANQRATKIGWIIKQLNLASTKGRSNQGVSYVFERVRVDAIYRLYFSTPPTPDSPEADDTGLFSPM